MRTLRTASLAAGAALLIGGMPAAASCAPPVPIEQAFGQADTIFVGTVVGLANADRRATFAVEEVWRGPDLPAQVIVRGGPDGDMFTSVDRTWKVNGKYLVFALSVEGQLTDNACSNTQHWADDLAPLRPTDARPPFDQAEGANTGGLPGTVLVAIGALGAIGLVSLLVFRRGR